jgi:signal transduction histidine kinase
LIFIDAGSEIDTAKTFLLNSVIIAGISLCVLLVLVSLLSKRAVQPFIQNIEAQKRFITDAAHELRTPLAIISSDNDVIEMTGEKSEWTESIRTQVHRMDGLINDLILMSRLEETRDKPVSGEVGIGELVTDKLADRKALLDQKNIHVEASVRREAVCTGDAKKHCAVARYTSGQCRKVHQCRRRDRDIIDAGRKEDSFLDREHL